MDAFFFCPGFAHNPSIKTTPSSRSRLAYRELRTIYAMPPSNYHGNRFMREGRVDKLKDINCIYRN